MALKRKHKLGLLLGSLFLALGGAGVAVALTSQPNTVQTEAADSYVFRTTVDTAARDSYWQSVNTSAIGSTMRDKLRNVIIGKQTKTTSYADLKTVLCHSDLDPAGSGKMLGFYEKTPLTAQWDSAKTWNREHVWPNSRGVGESGPGSDAHMIRPAAVSANSSRGNAMFALSGAFDPGYKYPEYRGEAARIIFYTATRWGTNNGLELTNNVSDSASNNTMGKLTDLLTWCTQYPVTQREIVRNECLYNYMGVRNPFIDHPEWASSIWSVTSGTYGSNYIRTSGQGESGSSSSSSSQGDSGVLTLSTSSLTIARGETAAVTPTVTGSSNTNVTWYTDDTDVATVSSYSGTSGNPITITAVGQGTTTLYVTHPASGSTASCSITVTASGGGESIGDSATILPEHFDTYIKTNGGEPVDIDQTGLTVQAYYVGNYSNSIQLKNGEGWLFNTTDNGQIYSIVFNNLTNGVTVTFGTSSSSNTSIASNVSGSTYTPKSGAPHYFKIASNNTGVVNCSGITINYVSGGSTTVPVTGVSISPTSLNLNVGDNATVTATISPNNATNKDYIFVSSDDSVVTVTDSGAVHANAAGTATITVITDDGEFEAECAVTVTAPVTKTLVDLDVSCVGIPTLTFGSTSALNLSGLSVTAEYSDGTSADVKSSATISSLNNKTLGEQTLTVSYTYGGVTKSGTFEAKVTNVGASQGSAGSVQTKTITMSTSSNGRNYSFDGTVVKSVSDSGSFGQDQGAFVQLGSGKGVGTLSISTASINMTKVTVNAKAYVNVNNVADTDCQLIFNDGEVSRTLDISTEQDYVFNLGTGISGSTGFTLANGAQKKRVVINSITVEYGSAGTLAFTDAEQSSAWGTYFLAKTYGNCSNATVWNVLKTEYNAMVSGAKTDFANKMATDYAEVIARYNVALSAHNMEDFLDIGGQSGLKFFKQTEHSQAFLVLGILAGASLGGGAWLFIRSKRRAG